MNFFKRSKSDESTFDAPTHVVDDLSGTYTIDASHSHLGFSARHAMVTTVRGQFGAYEGTAVVDTTTPANSSVTITIQTASIDTSSEDRDGHLRSADFFDSETYPTITFTSTDVKREGSDWEITGDLTIKGVTKSVTIPFEETGSAQDPFGNTRIGFEGSTSINRKDWGLTWNAALETGGVLVSEKIKLDFDISAIKNA
ncbi:YceI family protein [Nocardioides jishulii]|uniref:YceI family protein n=1 Tax=Nocardioides jishulii TaxID=2575440 RepID=A0A4U2YRG0_9ACTN|nr:YceI family protein [Nocardioides jishulii]QCX26200.1 YceI family protein [Nocardioides jishulii]TKI63999.1 YceI family protein [Nocardioides jishulii]